MYGNDCTTITITAKNLEEALTKAYSYFGGRNPLTPASLQSKYG